MGLAQLNRQPVSDFVGSKNIRSRRIQFETGVSVLERIADLAAVMAAALLSYFTYEYLEVGRHLHYSTPTVLTASFIFAAVSVIMLDQDGAYERGNSLLRIRETERILRVCTRTFAIAFLVSFFLWNPFSRWVVVLTTIFVPLLLILEKQLFFLAIRHLHSRGYGLQNVLVYGAGFTGRRLFSALVSSPKVGLNPVAIVDDNAELAGQRIYQWGYRRERSAPVIAGPVTSDLIREWRVSLVVVGIPSLPSRELSRIAACAGASGANVAFVPQLAFDAETWTEYVDLDGVLIASLGNHSSRKQSYETAKRFFDLIVALLLLVLSSPLWALIALLIWRDSKGPVFFRQARVGLGGKMFTLYKFRSMKVDAPKFALHPTDARDPRVTRFGSWLRRTSLDELPQLINVIRGDMSLVGPRPEMPFIVKGYNGLHWQRLNVVPGLTGLWQLSADRAFLIHENIQYDLYYIRNRNFFMDMAIVLHTVVFAMKGM
jgi:exopolysaccharide biosynthesis polyprenyl glycosylphosphotransferase